MFLQFFIQNVPSLCCQLPDPRRWKFWTKKKPRFQKAK